MWPQIQRHPPDSYKGKFKEGEELFEKGILSFTKITWVQGEQGEKSHGRKEGLLARINDEKKESKRYTDDIHIDAEKFYSDAFVLMEETKEKKI